ncbi:MAG: hypothetical protein HOM69_07365 [Gammaproteobacteria bacterium]|jgi:hypothetical protein|nr:hypothetical protein [Gammaproteobacteria bacterium]
MNFESKQVAGGQTPAAIFLKLSLPLVLVLAPTVALSDQLVWVLGSFSDAETAEQVAREVQELTGQSGYVQTAVVNGRGVHRALIDPGVTDDAQARTTALLSETVYNRTWGFELDTDGENVAGVGGVVMNQALVAAVVPGSGQKNSEPLAAPAAAELKGRQTSVMKQGDTLDAGRTVDLSRPPPRATPIGVASDYHPIRLKSDR